MGKFSKLFNQATDTKVNPGDETTMAKNPRNMLADAVNPLLDEYINPVLPEAVQMAIPKMTVADDKNYFANLPEQMGGATMGSLKRFDKLLPQAEQGIANFGKVITKPSMADLVDDVSKFGQKSQLGAVDISSKFNQIYGAEAAARKSNVLKGLISPEAYSSWKQEMMNKIRLGE